MRSRGSLTSKNMDKKINVEISTGIILRTIVILLALGVLYLVRDILALLFVTVIIVSVLNPIVNYLHKKRIPRPLGVLAIYLILFLIIGIAISFLIPPAVNQIKDFTQNLPAYTQNISGFTQKISNFFQTQHIAYGNEQIFSDITSKLPTISGGIFSTTVGILSGLFTVIVILVLAFYMMTVEDGIRNFIVFITPEKHKEYAGDLVTRMEIKIGKWMNGQLIIMLLVFILDFIGLWLVGVPYSLILAIIAALFELIPFIGPTIGSIPGIIIGFTISPLLGFSTVLIYLLVQQIESNIIVPQVMKRTVGLNPIAVILVLLVGAKLGGLLGVVLSVPAATAISVFVEDLFKDRMA